MNLETQYNKNMLSQPSYNLETPWKRNLLPDSLATDEVYHVIRWFKLLMLHGTFMRELKKHQK